MAARRHRWDRDELIVALDFYCRTPFGRLHQRNPDVIALAKAIGRTPSAVAMKLVNFASLDPLHHSRGIRGLANVSHEDRTIWKEFESNLGSLVIESSGILRRIGFRHPGRMDVDAMLNSDMPTEAKRQSKVRLVQGFFRDTVLASYDFSCAFCDLSLRALLNASHIIPWSQDASRRADPRNGIALCAFHDRAFDRGLVTVRQDLTIAVSRKAKTKKVIPLQQVGLLDIESKPMRLPSRFAPDEFSLAYHYEQVFVR
jgi:putative restriction endonuclease